MYGIKHSETTKQKIGERTREYMKDVDIKKKHSKAIKDFWESPEAVDLKKKYALLRTEEAKNKNPLTFFKCVFCGKMFEKKFKSKKQTCSAGCSQKYNWKIGKMTCKTDGKKVYKIRILNSLKLFSGKITKDNFKDVVIKMKEDKIISKHFSLNDHVIEKYFGSIENMIEELDKWEN